MSIKFNWGPPTIDAVTFAFDLSTNIMSFMTLESATNCVGLPGHH